MCSVTWSTSKKYCEELLPVLLLHSPPMYVGINNIKIISVHPNLNYKDNIYISIHSSPLCPQYHCGIALKWLSPLSSLKYNEYRRTILNDCLLDPWIQSQGMIPRCSQSDNFVYYSWWPSVGFFYSEATDWPLINYSHCQRICPTIFKLHIMSSLQNYIADILFDNISTQFLWYFHED